MIKNYSRYFFVVAVLFIISFQASSHSPLLLDVDCEMFRWVSADTNLATFSRLYRNFRPTDEGANKSYEAMARDISQEALFVVVANGVLKRLNDNILKSRELSEILTAHFQQILLRRFKSLGLNPKTAYSDYKDLRFGFEKRSEDDVARIKQAYFLSINEFAVSLALFPEIMQRLVTIEGRARDPRWWFLMGMGNFADGAAVSERLGRFQFEVNQKPIVFDFNDPKTVDLLMERLFEADGWMLQMGRLLKRSPAAFEQVESATMILSLPALTILVKAESLADIQKQFSRRFKVTLTQKEALVFRHYFTLIDTFAPPIYVNERANIILPKNKDIVWIDIRQQNTRNLYQVTKNAALMTKKIQDLQHSPDFDKRQLAVEFLHRSRAAQDQESKNFSATIDAIELAIRDQNLVGDQSFSAKNGLKFESDEGAFVAQKPLTYQDLLGFVGKLAVRGKAGHYRIIHPYKADLALIKRMEQFEKDLRDSIEGLHPDFNFQFLQDVLFAIDLQRSSNGLTVNIIIAGKRHFELVPAIQNTVKRLLLNYGWRPGRVEYALQAT